MRFLLLLLTVSLANAQGFGGSFSGFGKPSRGGSESKPSQKRAPVINRDEIEYAQGTPCPITYVEPSENRAVLSERLSQGFKICKKGNIANCPRGSTFYMDERRLGKCQHCVCDTESGGLWTAHCNKVDCKTLPKSTPTPGKGALGGRGVRQNCSRTKPKVCKEGCRYMARYRTCVYCDCSNQVDFTKEQYRI